MPKILLVHQDDVGRSATLARALDSGAVSIERDRYGVCKPGEGFELTLPDSVPPLPRPSLFRAANPDLSDALLAFRYSTISMRKPLRMFYGIDLATDFVRRRPWRLSLKLAARAQRSLERTSNVRRRKRWLELKRRRRDE